MTTKNETKNPFFGAQANLGGVNEVVREVVGIQLRGAQYVMDKSIGFGQAWTDFVHTQMHEGMKLSQEFIKHGWNLTEGAKNTACEMTEKAFKAPSA